MIDENCPQPTIDEQAHDRRGRLLLRILLAAAVIVLVVGVAQAAERGTVTSGTSYTLLRAGQLIKSGLASQAACDAEVIAQRAIDAPNKTSAAWRYTCRTDKWTNVSYGPNAQPQTCPSAPATQTRQMTCPAGSSGTWTQTGTALVGAPPACTVSVSWQPIAPTNSNCPSIPVEPTGTATLSWTPPTANTNGTPLTDLAGYRINYGQTAAALSRTIQISSGGVVKYEVNDLTPGIWYFAVRAYTSGNRESASSNIASKEVK